MLDRVLRYPNKGRQNGRLSSGHVTAFPGACHLVVNRHQEEMVPIVQDGDDTWAMAAGQAAHTNTKTKQVPVNRSEEHTGQHGIPNTFEISNVMKPLSHEPLWGHDIWSLWRTSFLANQGLIVTQIGVCQGSTLHLGFREQLTEDLKTQAGNKFSNKTVFFCVTVAFKIQTTCAASTTIL